MRGPPGGGVTQMVRGRDLLSSSPLQIYILKLLGLTPPSYFHVPLLLTPEGRKLSEMDGDLNLSASKRRGNPEHLIGYLAFLAGQLEKPEAISAESLVKIFNPDKIPLGDITIDGGGGSPFERYLNKK
ncbi:MAG: glutamate--tRNA ligase family protein, partial [Phascolarctobacterium sp.]|nr:glutamate--tRNA ligase family protein [Phascolarctobacterium sp.]